MMYCHEQTGKNGIRFNDFYPHTVGVKMCGSGEIFKVLVAEEPMANDKDTYWGWWNLKESRFVFVYPHQMLLYMCFAYGPEVEEEKGEGIRLPVKIEVLERNV